MGVDATRVGEAIGDGDTGGVGSDTGLPDAATRNVVLNAPRLSAEACASSVDATEIGAGAIDVTDDLTEPPSS